MFPFWRGASARLGELAAASWFRTAAAVLLVVFHLMLFARAGNDRLHVGFDSAPDHKPYFSDPDAPATRAHPRQPHFWSRLVVSRFDAQHYIGMAERGLSACPTDRSAPDVAYLDCGLGWLPAWGTLGGVVEDVAHAGSDQALLFLSLIAALALNLLWTSATMVKRLGRGVAWASLIGFNVYPAAFYIVTPYPEAATLALALGGFIALAQDRMLLAAVLVGASTALQPTAIAFAAALGCALVVATYERHEQKRSDWWRPLLGLPLLAWGLLATMVVLQLTVGDWSAFWRARRAAGDVSDWSRLRDVTYFLNGLHGQDMETVMLLGFAAIFAFTARDLLRRFTRIENAFLIVASCITIIAATVTPVHYWGMTRMLLLCPLAFVSIGMLARKQPVLFVLWCVLCLSFYWYVDLCDYVTQGNAHVCPALGKLEMMLPF